MKKLLVIMLSLFMVLALVSCGGDDSASSDVSTDTETEEVADTPQFEEIVLFDTDEATMKIVDYDPDDTWGFALKVYLENKTDKILMFAADDASVNGYMMDPFWASEVAGGKKENTEITWFTDDLESNGIESVEEIEMTI